MSVPVKKQAKKRKSQVPVALVYFATLMLFIAVFGLIASFIIAFSPLTELMMRKITIIINMIAAP